ncbi:dephospho-CoA kinase domain-containing protein [Sarcoptes scabiei]|nr:dephospho-CoA kinase domain-containing protein [Sarcoptes scabiei]
MDCFFIASNNLSFVYLESTLRLDSSCSIQILSFWSVQQLNIIYLSILDYVFVQTRTREMSSVNNWTVFFLVRNRFGFEISRDKIFKLDYEFDQLDHRSKVL